MLPGSDVRRNVDRRLLELHDRHREVALGDDARFYEPGRGYHPFDEVPANHDRFAIALASVSGEVASVGDDESPFALQSLSKVFAYGLALEDHGRERVLERVGVEPSGDAFHSIIFDERHNRAYNAMVNAGALVTSDLVIGADATEKAQRMIGSLREYAGSDRLEVDQRVLALELSDADRNRATAYLMRARGMIKGDVEATVKLYLSLCAVKVTCVELAVMAATLANGGVNPRSGRVCLPRPRVRDVLSVMYTCGMYDFAGERAYEVGVPAKSGVSGAIMCVIPGKLGFAVFSPGLDSYGNSIRGVGVCQEISQRLGLHVFATEDEDVLHGMPASRAS